MKKFVVITYFLFSLPFILEAQKFSNDFWGDGFLVLANHDTLEGQINYLPENDIIRLRKDAVVKAFSPVKVYFATFYDENLERQRELWVFNYKKVTDYEVPTFFEIGLDGDYVDVLYREDAILIEGRSYVVEPYTGIPLSTSYNRVRDFRSLYLRKGDGDIVFFSGKKKDLLNFLAEYRSAVKKYLKENKLKLSDIEDLVKAIKFFNNLKASNG